jgi:excinuclease ABC subunit C
VDLATRQAEEALAEHGARARAAQHALRALQGLLGLGRLPERIEGYDLSHLGGDAPVAAMAVLVGGVPDSASYRHFAIREAAGGDDFAGMAEVIRRRFAAGSRLGEEPDLVLIDGGPGQVASAVKALAAAGASGVPVVGLAKARRESGRDLPERIWVAGEETSRVPDPDDPGLGLLVRVRDEAHRFAGRYQRKLRRRSVEPSALDVVPGLGPVRRRRLLAHFGSAQGVREAPFEDLAGFPGVGERMARLILERLG